MSTPEGWYPNGEHWETYWNGQRWTDLHRPVGRPRQPGGQAESLIHSDPARPLLTFSSHIEGRNALVSIYPDRVEWIKRRGMSGARVPARIMTVGRSMIASGAPKRADAETEMIPVRSISSVTTRRDGFLNTVVSVVASCSTVDFRIAHKEAEQVKNTLIDLIRATHESHREAEGTESAAPIVSDVSAPASAPPLSAAAPNAAAQLHQLGALRDAGILTEDEFAAKKSELLARL